MDDEYSQRAYFESVNASAKRVDAAIKAGEDESDAIHKEVDDDRWVIITHQAIKCLLYSPNDEAVFGAMGDDEALRGVTSMSEVYTRAAYYAMHQDVSDALGALREEDTDSED